MVIQFVKQKNHYRRGIATEKDCEIEFTIGECGYANELLINKEVEDTFVIKMIETLLNGNYSEIIYKGIRYFRHSNVKKIMEQSSRH